MITIRREDFLRILAEEKRDFEKFHELKDKAKFSNNYRNLFVTCKSCGSEYHETVDCEVVHIEKDPYYISLASNKSTA